MWEAGCHIPSGVSGAGPIVVFTHDLSASIVISAFSNFMAHNQYYDTDNSILYYGVMGSVQSIPAGYVIETIIYAGEGINSVMLGWGDVLLQQYGKERDAYKRDFTLRYLGYSTDNGAYYVSGSDDADAS